jgi:hypothetical protein
MEMREKWLADENVGYTCDICNKPCFKENGANRLDSDEHATLRAEWGYWSDGSKDGTVHECQMCEACYEKVRFFIEHELKGKVRVTESWHISRPTASQES